GVENHRACSLRARAGDAPVGRARIYVNHLGCPSRYRVEAALQPLSLVASNQNESQPTHLFAPCAARLMIRAGTPAAVAAAGTSRTTTAFAPTTASSPTNTGPSTFAPAPTSTRFPSLGASKRVATDLLPRVTPWRMMQSSPMT